MYGNRGRYSKSEAYTDKILKKRKKSFVSQFAAILYREISSLNLIYIKFLMTLFQTIKVKNSNKKFRGLYDLKLHQTPGNLYS